MTTKYSSPTALKLQANRIAQMLKKAERGEQIDIRFAEKVMAARQREMFKVGIVMDDKVIMVDIPWETISASSESDLATFIMGQMKR